MLMFMLCNILLSANAQSKLEPAAIAQWREDLQVLAGKLPQRHKNLFAAMTREQFEQGVKRLDARIPSLNPQQIFVEMRRLVALAKDGHTVIVKRDLKNGFIPLRYPLNLFLYRDGLFVQSAEAHWLLGDAYDRAGDVKKAITAYEQSLALNPKSWELRDRLAALREVQRRNPK
jgi:tetratricopeptide (TPR) repeat protein